MSNTAIKYLVFDVESVPDTRLIKMVKYPGMDITEQEAVKRFQEEILTNSGGASYFIPVTFQYPIAVCVAKVRADFSLDDVVLLDEPEFRTREMVRLFWHGIENLYGDASLVTFNGRGFDIPLLELMAFRYGFTIKRHMRDKFGSRYRFGTKHIDLHDWLSNFNAIKMQGGLNLLAKVLGKPGKMETTGDEVYDMFLEGKIREINDYCSYDVLDTYFVFLRSRVMLGELAIQKEQELVQAARRFINENQGRFPAFKTYNDNWGDWDPWP
ncbi:MAG TPA: 3'-5' exonuclease [Spirochaetes bacterium]|nr:3'-5' exonuclease [Spirochaetota bacterium]